MPVEDNVDDDDDDDVSDGDVVRSRGSRLISFAETETDCNFHGLEFPISAGLSGAGEKDA